MKKILSRPLVPATLLLAALVLVLAWGWERFASRREAQEKWRENEQVIRDVAMGQPGSVSAFQDACHFFYRLTGITVPHDYSTYLGAKLPNKNTATALKPLQRWYSENKDRLYWDKEHEEVRLAPTRY